MLELLPEGIQRGPAVLRLRPVVTIATPRTPPMSDVANPRGRTSIESCQCSGVLDFVLDLRGADLRKSSLYPYFHLCPIGVGLCDSEYDPWSRRTAVASDSAEQPEPSIDWRTRLGPMEFVRHRQMRRTDASARRDSSISTSLEGDRFGAARTY